MSYLRARQLLVKVAGIYQREKERYTHKEILEKINQIKYMSAQKKVSRLSIRKEIVLLENKISGLFELDKRVERKKLEESVRINALKRQVEMLKKRLVSSQCPELQDKVETLSHLLGDFMAKKVTEEDIALSQKLVEELQKKPKAKAPEPIKTTAVSAEVPPDPEKVFAIQQKLQQLKEELEFNPLMDPLKKKMLEGKIKLLEEKFSKYAPKMPVSPVESFTPKKAPPLSEALEVKHDILFSLPKKIMPKTNDKDLEIERTLPLPPPPRMKYR